MSLDETLSRAAADAERGDLGKARDRLEGLLRAYPDSLEIRRRLGDVYWRLQYPERAGLHWYLLPTDSPEMEAAKDIFARRYGNDAWFMLDRIRYHGGLESVAGTHAETVLRDLASRAGVSERKLEQALRRREPGEHGRQITEPWWGRFVIGGVVLFILTIGVLAFMGLFALLTDAF